MIVPFILMFALIQQIPAAEQLEPITGDPEYDYSSIFGTDGQVKGLIEDSHSLNFFLRRRYVNKV